MRARSSSTRRPTTTGSIGDRRRRKGLLKELKAKIEALKKGRLPSRLQRRAVQEVSQVLFSLLDVNNSGYIEQGEQLHFAGMLSVTLDDSLEDKLEGSQHVTREEFGQFMEALAENMGVSHFVEQLLLVEAALDNEEHFEIDPRYKDLQTSSGCFISRTEQRGITLKQLGLLKAHVERRCESEGWTDRNPHSPTHGKQISPSAINLYQVCDWVVRPATEKRQCSYVELVAGHLQVPRWFVSHWWGEPVFDFIACLQRHAKDRELKDASPYWVCAYANNQWRLQEELVEDLGQTSFRKAMNLAEGTVSVLDKSAICYSRVWCCYEVHTSIVTLKRTGGLAPYRYDMYTATDGEAVGITDGFAKVDLKSRLPSDSKYEREQGFPPHLMDQALHIELQKAAATAEGDKRRILNCIVGAEDSSRDPPTDHPLYNDLNATLRGRYAAAGLRRALEAGELAATYLEALAGSKLRKLTLSFYNCEAMTDDRFLALVSSLPPTLLDLDLDFSFCTELTDDGVCNIGEFLSPKLRRLALSFTGCQGPSDITARSLASVIASLPLEDLSLNFYGNKAVSDKGMLELAAALPKGLSRLCFDISFCWSVTDLSVVTLSQHFTATLRELDVNLRTLTLTEATGMALAAAIPSNLEHFVLDLRFCESLGDTVAEAIAAHLPKRLRYLLLHFWNWPLLTDRGVQAVAAALPGTLRHAEIFLGANPQLTDQSVQALAAGLPPSMVELLVKFSDCPLLTLKGAWQPLAKALPTGMEQFELWIDGCTEASDAKASLQKALKGRSTNLVIHC